jgi:hypothetical protein
MKYVLSLLIFLSSFAYAQKPVDKLNVPGPIKVNKKTHVLAWTASPPSGNFFKQEYIPAGENLNKFTSMVLVDVSLDNVSLKDIVAAKMNELKKMKETNPMVNYEVFQKNGEYLLDFLLSANSADGKTMEIVERNVYRYQIFTDKSGKKAVLLFGVSVRSYGNDIDNFLKKLKADKSALLNEVAKFSMPAISISK